MARRRLTRRVTAVVAFCAKVPKLPLAARPEAPIGPEGKMAIAAEGAAELRMLLAANDPRRVIPEFQRRNSLVAAPNAEAAVQFLTLLGVRRHIAHESVLSRLVDRLVAKIETLPEDALLALLERSFGYIALEELRRIPVAILLQLRPVPQPYLLKLAESASLLERLPLELRRQVWELKPDAFSALLDPLMTAYRTERTSGAAYQQEAFPRDGLTPKRRRDRDATLQQIVQLIGASPALYLQAMHAVKKRFADTKDYVFCELRTDLLMALQDKGVAEVYSQDEVHLFAWCLENKFTENIEKVHDFLAETVGKGSLIADMAMVVGHPGSRWALLAEVYRVLREVANSDRLPKDNEDLRFYTNLLYLYSLAPMLQRRRLSQLPTAPEKVYTEFFPRVVHLIHTARLGHNEEPLDASIVEAFKDAFLRQILLYLLLQSVRNRDSRRVQLLSEAVAMTLDSVTLAGERSFLHSYVTELLHAPTLLSDANVRRACVEMFLLKHAAFSATVHRELSRLVKEFPSSVPLVDASRIPPAPLTA